MTEHSPGPEALARAQGLTDALTEMAAEVRRLRTYGRRNRAFVIVVIALSLAIILAGGIAVHATGEAETAVSAQLALCQSSNVARAQQVSLWEFLIHLGAPPRTAKGRMRVSEFEHHLYVVFAKRDCAALASK